jgi:hypothetical protein
MSYVGSFLPHIIEKYYSMGINRVLIQGLSTVTGILPFSLAEMLVIFLVLVGVWKLIGTLVLLLKKREGGIGIISTYLLNLLSFLSVVYLLFILLWGLNYNRITFANIAHLTIQPASTEELAAVCNILIERTNQLRMKVDEDQSGVMRVSGGKIQMLNRGDAGYQEAAAIYPELGGRYGNPKGILASEIMSYMGLDGVYCPFTGEANVNMAVPDAMLPCTVSHEMAHQRGFAREDEANYIAYLTCKLNPDTDFQYSGNLLAVINSMNVLEKNDIERYTQLRKSYSNGVRKDLEDYSLFIKKHESLAGRISSDANDLYLKSNRQSDGVYSYNRMVDLIIAEYRN